MLKFGGTPSFVYEGDPEHKWTIVDRKKLANTVDQELLESYDKSVKGTELLYANLQKRGVSLEYLMLCLLYHQLLYTLTLTCIYQV